MKPAAVLRLYVSETGKEIRQRKLNYCLGSCSVFIVVLVIALMLTVLANAPVLFLSLSEQENGEMDLLIVNRDRLLDFDVANSTARAFGTRDTYGCPRIDWDLRMVAAKYCVSYAGPYSHDCAAVTRTLGTAFAVDDAAERRAGLGRAWTRRGFNGTAGIAAGDLFLSASLASSAGAVGDDTVLLQTSLPELLGETVWRNMTSGLPPQPRQLELAFRVAGVYAGGGGKHASSVQGMVLEGRTLMAAVAASLAPGSSPVLAERLRNRTWSSGCTSVAWNLPPLRVDNYRSSDQSEIEAAVAGYMSSLLFRVSWTDVETSLPVLRGVKSYRFFSLFLGLILNIIILFIFFLSVLLIYSLLMVSVESRTFELGILRMVGMTRGRLVGLVITQAVFYSVPGIGIGLPVAQGLAVLVANYLGGVALVQLSPLLTPLSIGLALLAGLLVPLIAAVVPIRAALAKNVWDSVDTRRSKTKAVEYKLSRTETDRPSATLLIIGAVLFALGFVIYYLLPLALLSSNIYLLLNIFFLLLILMLVGLVVLASNLQPVLEWCFMWGCFFWEQPAVRSVALRNFDAHRRRNAKTAIMFSISLAFMIFLQVTFTTQLNTIIAQTNQRRASTLSVRASRANLTAGGVPGLGLSVRALEEFAAGQSLVRGLGWATFPMEWQAEGLVDVSAESVGHLSQFGQNIIGVSPSLFANSFSGFTVVADGVDPYPGTRPTSRERVLERLYSRRGSQGVLLGAKYEPSIGTAGPPQRPRDLLLPHVLRRNASVQLVSPGGGGSSASSSSSVQTILRRVSVEAFMGLAPLFSFSSFPSGSSNDVLVSLPTMARLLRGLPGATVSSVDSLRMEVCVVGMSESASNRQIDAVKRALIRAVEAGGVPEVTVLDSRDSTNSLNTARQLINFFFLFTVVIALVICFFSLSSSMYTNIYEQSKEIGVLLALGMAKLRVARLFVWEAICVVLAASTLGIAIGVLVAWTLTLQQALFTQLPTPFEFPWLITVVVIFLSLVFGFLSSVGPLRTMLSKSPVAVLRQ